MSTRTDTPAHPPRVRAPFLVSYGLANFGLWLAVMTPVIVSLQLRVAQIDPVAKERNLSLVLGLGAFVGMVANPIAGRMSDRTASRFGMRKPWIVGSALLGVAGLTVVAMGDTIAVVAAGWCLAQISYNAMLAGLMAVLPDQVPPEQRGTVSGTLGMGQAVAAVVGTGIAGALSDSALLMFVVPGVVAAVSAIVMAVQLRDRRLDPVDRPPFAWADLARSFSLNPRQHPDFAWAWLSRFMIFMAIASVLNYQVYYLQDRLGLGDDVTRVLGLGVVVQTVTVVLTSNLMGWLSDRVGRRRIFVCIAGLVAASGLVLLAVADDLPLYVVAMALTGLGQGTYFAVDFALVADVLPDRRRNAAKDLGVINVANTLPQSLAPAIAPVFLAVGAGDNYPLLFTAGAVFALLSGLTVLKIRGAR
ncbi:MFS transporter [Lentzea pudingi]|uniref:MFS transporter n=1 Tax=Lentzea pudingi TaxID=1789439 RepID=A0ABQ2HYX7_9PSEU|nr:MFS transporter [Lentzea pudingi]GGM94875.1 MFS transporter [Lentzea pudingi]